MSNIRYYAVAYDNTGLVKETGTLRTTENTAYLDAQKMMSDSSITALTVVRMDLSRPRMQPYAVLSATRSKTVKNPCGRR